MKILTKLKRTTYWFFCRCARKLKISTCTVQNKAKKRKEKLHPKKTRRQIGSFLNRYDFSYAGRDTVNQAANVAPSIIKDATNEINNITQQGFDQIISQGDKEIERVLLRILRGAIENVYQTPFSLLGDFGKKQLNKLKNKILK